MNGNSLWTLGLICGLTAALFQSFSYLCGRYFLSRAGNARQLLAASVFEIGIAALVAMLFLTPDWTVFFSWRMLGVLTICNGGFLIGHWCFFSAQKHIESSRIASLIGLKILVVVFFLTLFCKERFTTVQYLAAGGTVIAALLMNYESGSFEWRGMGFLLFSVCGYACSDVGVQILVRDCSALFDGAPIRSGLTGFFLTYGTMLLFTAPMLWVWRVGGRMMLAALPQAFCWAAAMVFLFICFGSVGAAFGNVLQAGRGLISLGIGVVLSLFAIPGFEAARGWRSWTKRGVAALIMFASICAYALNAQS